MFEDWLTALQVAKTWGLTPQTWSSDFARRIPISKRRPGRRCSKAIQRILTIWNRWIDDAPGTEWNLTSKDEVLSIVNFLNSPRPDGARKNGDAV